MLGQTKLHQHLNKLGRVTVSGTVRRTRTKLESGKRRHEFQTDHGFRKWFKTRCELAGMKPINIEKLMNHSIGISNSYYRATENELLEDYLKAVEVLTISQQNKLIFENHK